MREGGCLFRAGQRAKEALAVWGPNEVPAIWQAKEAPAARGAKEVPAVWEAKEAPAALGAKDARSTGGRSGGAGLADARALGGHLWDSVYA